MTLVIGITGGIASGKSTLTKRLKTKGYPTHDSDEEVNNLYNKPKDEFLVYLKKIGLGKSIKNKKINKKTISNIIFDNQTIKTKLEAYVFKIVRAKRSKFIKKHKKLKTKLIFIDVPLLFENNLDNLFDKIICVISKRSFRLHRLKKIKKINEIFFKKVLKFQTTDTIRKKRSDIVMYNNLSKKIFYKNIEKKLKEIHLERSGNWYWDNRPKF